MSSRLFLEIREKRSLCYDVHSYVNHYLDTGSTVVSAGVDPSKLDEALRATIAELLKMAERVPEKELTKAKEFIKGRLQLRMEDTRADDRRAGIEVVVHVRVHVVAQAALFADLQEEAAAHALAENSVQHIEHVAVGVRGREPGRS